MKRKTITIDIGKVPDWVYAQALAQGFQALKAQRKAQKKAKRRGKK